MVDSSQFFYDLKTTKNNPHEITINADGVIKFDQQAIDELINRMTATSQSQQRQFVLDEDAIRRALGYAHSPNRQPKQQTFQVGDDKYVNKDDIPPVDIHKWAKNVGLEISDDGKTITCYKAVHKVGDGEYAPVMYASNGTVYKTGEYAFADKLDLYQFSECSSGLHAGNMTCATEYINSDDDVIIELKVDISDPNNYVIPYVSAGLLSTYYNTVLYPSNKKFRFLKAYVVREVPVKKVFYDESTGKTWDI